MLLVFADMCMDEVRGVTFGSPCKVDKECAKIDPPCGAQTIPRCWYHKYCGCALIPPSASNVPS